MKKLYKIGNGKCYLKIEKGSPYYTSGSKEGPDVLVRKLFSIFGYSVSIRQKGSTDFSKKAKARMYDMLVDYKWPRINMGDNHWYNYKDIKFVFNGDMWSGIPDSKNYPGTMLYNITRDEVHGFTHRGRMSFKKGDILFDLSDENEEEYFKNPKYRWKYIEVLINAHVQDDDESAYNFKYVLEQGIKCVVPLKIRGSKVIKNTRDAMQAASNFSEYLS